MLKGSIADHGVQVPTQLRTRCPKCGRQVRSLRCGHCGSRLPSWQAELYGSTVKKIAKMGGNRPDTTSKGDIPTEAADEDLQNTQTPPSLCRWIHERLLDAGVSAETILDPCAGSGNLTQPFHAKVIEYEIQRGSNFFEAKERISCDLVICNPPWSEAERWLRHSVEIVGNRMPMVFICPLLFFSGYKTAPCRKYLESPEAPTLHHITPLPQDTFVKVYCAGAILWLNLPKVQNVALVPSECLIRKNELS